MDYAIKSETLESIANAIRQKTGKTEKMLPTKFADEITAITGGGSSGEKPTLFAPSVELNSVSSILTITDNKNGDFEVSYKLYANDNFITTLSSKTATLADYMEHTETIDIKVQAASAMFNPSNFAVVEWIKFSADGTAGLAYELSSDGAYAICTSIGDAIETDIEIAVKYDGVPVTEIGKNAFEGSNITSVTIPDGVTKIDDDAFSGCTALSDVHIPNSVNMLGDWVFEKCTALETIEIPRGVKSIRSGTFYSCRKLKNLILNEGLESFGSTGSSINSSCPALTQLYLPSTVTSFSRNSIDVKYITDVYFAGTIDQWAKCGKAFLVNNGDNFEFSNPLERGANFHINADLKNIVLTDATHISSTGLAFITTMESIHLPKTLSSIYQLAFYGCKNLISITIDEENSNLRVEGNCVIQKSHNQIIAGCVGSVIPDGVASIFDYAFAGSGLKTVIIPSSVASIGSWAFAHSSLENAIIQGTATALSGTFHGCYELKSVSISGSVGSIGLYTFSRCPNLKRVDFSTHTSVPTLSSKVFYNTHADLQIKVPANLIDEWKAATNWADYADKIVTEFTNEV